MIKQCTVYLEKDLHAAARIKAFENDISFSDFVSQAIEAKLVDTANLVEVAKRVVEWYADDTDTLPNAMPELQAIMETICVEN